MQTVGEALRKARIQQNLSLDELYKQTKIHTHVLEALEQDRAHNFLSFVYIRSFLKAYAQYLGLDGEKLLKEYVDSQTKETPQTPEKPVPPAQEQPKKKKKSFTFPEISSFLTLRMVAIFVLSLALIFYFRYVARTISHSRQLVQAKPPAVKIRVLPAEQTAQKLLNLQVWTKQECWIKVKADGEVIFQNTLPKGKIEKWQAQSKIELRIGKPEALEVQLNGEPINLSKLNVKKGLIVTHEGIQGQ